MSNKKIVMKCSNVKNVTLKSGTFGIRHFCDSPEIFYSGGDALWLCDEQSVRDAILVIFDNFRTS